MANTRKRKTVWKDVVIDNQAIAGATILNLTILSEIDIEGLGDVTVSRIVGQLSFAYAVGTRNTLKSVIWVSPTWAGVTLPVAWIADAFERSRVMWTMHAMQDLADDTRHIELDIRTKRKLSSGVELTMTLENTAANIVDFALHTRVLLALA